MAVEDENEETTTEETPATGGEGAATPSLFDAINSALEPTLPKTEETPAEESTDEETEADELDTDEETGGEEETSEGDKPRGADGKYLKTDKTGKTEGSAEEAGAGKPKLGPDGKPVAAEPKKADPVNDPIPEEIKGRTRERMTQLIDTVKAKDEVIGNQNTIIEAVKATGASPDEFAAMISYMGWVRSDKQENLVLARDMLVRELEGVSLKLGEAAPGIDFIAKHPDIKAAVEAGQITQEAAQELAIARTRTKTQQEATAARSEAEETTQLATQQRNAAIKELDTLGKQLQKSDPDFDAKHEIIEPMLESLGMLPPAQWRRAFERAWDKAGTVLVARRAAGKTTANGGTTPAGGTAKGGTPLRANKSPSGGQNRQPTSLLDAVSAAVDSVGQG